jgi:uncharacterized protein YbaR (Trm112 family)
MHVELIDTLRCPRPHADGWLVAAATRTVGRHIVEGTLGCPICEAEFPVRGGVVRFDGRESPRDSVATPAQVTSDEALRLAALLDLTDPGGTVLLAGEWDAVAGPLVDLIPINVLLLDSAHAGSHDREEISALVGGGVPVARGSMRGIGLDDAAVANGLLEPAVRALRTRGRLVAPASAPTPAEVRELARDARHWVAERLPVEGAPVRLARARG